MEETPTENIKWSAPEYVQGTKNADWFWYVGFAAVASAFIALWFGSYLFAIFILISAVMLIMLAIRSPKQIEFEVGADGIKIGNDVYFYNKMHGYKMIEGNPYAKLLIETDASFLPVHTIPVPEGLEKRVNDWLVDLVPVTEIKQSKSMLLADKLGF